LNSGQANSLESGDIQILLGGVPGISSRGYLGYSTVALFKLDNAWALFDTGHYNDRFLLVKALAERGIVPSEIRHVVLSHLHFDHCLNLSLFPCAEVFISQDELDYARAVQQGAIIDTSIPDCWAWLLEGRRVRVVDRELSLSPGLRLALFAGHTPGCLALFFEQGQTVAVCGDIIKNAWEAVRGQSAMAEDGEKAAHSIRALLDQAEIILPGHDRPFRLNGDTVQYLAGFALEVRLSLFPEPPEIPLLHIDLPPGESSLAKKGLQERCLLTRKPSQEGGER